MAISTKPSLSDQERYDLARARVKQLKGFYWHLTVYILVNLMILVLKSRHLSEDGTIFIWDYFKTPFFWGIGLLAHAFTVFMPNLLFGRHLFGLSRGV